MSREALHIAGAGPAGLAAAITAARAGVPTIVHERRATVGARFHGDFQGLENWTRNEDILGEFHRLGIEATFDYTPFSRLVTYNHDGRERCFDSKEPMFYLVRRGSSEGTLDQSLKRQALAAGAEIRFNDTVREPKAGSIAAWGPRRSDAISVGYLFESDAPDGAYAAASDSLAPKGYSYLLIAGGQGTIATCMFGSFTDVKRCVERTVEFFRKKVSFTMRNPRHFGGYGNIYLPKRAVRNGVAYAGEAAGFQDALWGFGIRSAVVSGCLAAQSVTRGEPASYESAWRQRLAGHLKSSIVNRVVYDRMGNRGYDALFARAGRAATVRDWLRKHYATSRLKSTLFGGLRVVGERWAKAG
ncbi:MAG: hypothetical protein HY261_06345 [Chloroflexi bacterium]|nr:hypothetical protein [Chloroflexota bacterium]